MKGRIDSVSCVIAASPTTLYLAYMNPEALSKWMPPTGMTAQVENFGPRVGGGYRMTLTYEEGSMTAGKTTKTTDVVETKFVELVPDKKIVGSGVFESEVVQYANEMVMSWFFEEVGEGTKVTVIAENVPPGIQKEAHIEGLNSTLENLEFFVTNQ